MSRNHVISEETPSTLDPPKEDCHSKLVPTTLTNQVESNNQMEAAVSENRDSSASIPSFTNETSSEIQNQTKNSGSYHFPLNSKSSKLQFQSSDDTLSAICTGHSPTSVKPCENSPLEIIINPCYSDHLNTLTGADSTRPSSENLPAYAVPPPHTNEEHKGNEEKRAKESEGQNNWLPAAVPRAYGTMNKLEETGFVTPSSNYNNNVIPIPELRRKLSYCSVCKIQYDSHKQANACLSRHGRRHCWLCLEVLANTKESYFQHCVFKHCVRNSCNIVHCPYCGRPFDFKQGFNQHIVKVHFAEDTSRIPTKTRALSPKSLVDIYTGQPRNFTSDISSVDLQQEQTGEMMQLKKLLTNGDRNLVENYHETSGEYPVYGQYEYNNGKLCLEEFRSKGNFQFGPCGSFRMNVSNDHRLNIGGNFSRNEDAFNRRRAISIIGNNTDLVRENIKQKCPRLDSILQKTEKPEFLQQHRKSSIGSSIGEFNVNTSNPLQSCAEDQHAVFSYNTQSSAFHETLLRSARNPVPVNRIARSPKKRISAGNTDANELDINLPLQMLSDTGEIVIGSGGRNCKQSLDAGNMRSTETGSMLGKSHGMGQWKIPLESHSTCWSPGSMSISQVQGQSQHQGCFPYSHNSAAFINTANIANPAQNISQITLNNSSHDKAYYQVKSEPAGKSMKNETSQFYYACSQREEYSEKCVGEAKSTRYDSTDARNPSDEHNYAIGENFIVGDTLRLLNRFKPQVTSPMNIICRNNSKTTHTTNLNTRPILHSSSCSKPGLNGRISHQAPTTEPNDRISSFPKQKLVTFDSLEENEKREKSHDSPQGVSSSDSPVSTQSVIQYLGDKPVSWKHQGELENVKIGRPSTIARESVIRQTYNGYLDDEEISLSRDNLGCEILQHGRTNRSECLAERSISNIISNISKCSSSSIMGDSETGGILRSRLDSGWWGDGEGCCDQTTPEQKLDTMTTVGGGEARSIISGEKPSSFLRQRFSHGLLSPCPDKSNHHGQSAPGISQSGSVQKLSLPGKAYGNNRAEHELVRHQINSIYDQNAGESYGNIQRHSSRFQVPESFFGTGPAERFRGIDQGLQNLFYVDENVKKLMERRLDGLYHTDKGFGGMDVFKMPAEGGVKRRILSKWGKQGQRYKMIGENSSKPTYKLMEEVKKLGGVFGTVPKPVRYSDLHMNDGAEVRIEARLNEGSYLPLHGPGSNLPPPKLAKNLATDNFSGTYAGNKCYRLNYGQEMQSFSLANPKTFSVGRKSVVKSNAQPVSHFRCPQTSGKVIEAATKTGFSNMATTPAQVLLAGRVQRVSREELELQHLQYKYQVIHQSTEAKGKWKPGGFENFGRVNVMSNVEWTLGPHPIHVSHQGNSVMFGTAFSKNGTVDGPSDVSIHKIISTSVSEPTTMTTSTTQVSYKESVVIQNPFDEETLHVLNPPVSSVSR